MIPIAGKPFLEHQITVLHQQSIQDIILCVGHLSEQIQNYFGDGEQFNVHLQYSHDGDTLLGPIGALKHAEPLLNDVFFIMYGDSYLSVDFQHVYSTFLQHDKPALMVVYKNKDKYDKSNLVVEENLIVQYGNEQKTQKMMYIDYGTSILRKETLETIPRDTFYSTGMFFSDLIKKRQLLAFEAKKRFYHIGTQEALEELREYLNFPTTPP